MIATLRANQTEYAQTLAPTQKIPVAIDIRVWRDIVGFFPVEGQHHQTAAANAECRLIVTAFILSALRDDYHCFSFNQSVLDRMAPVGSRKRKKLVEYFDRSRFSKVVVNYSTDHHSIIRTLAGVRVEQWSRYQHNMMQAVSDALLSLPLCWRFSGETVVVNMPVHWYQNYGVSYRQACSQLFPDQWQFATCIESSVSQCVVSLPTYEECLDAANHSRSSSETSPEVKAEIYRRMWKEWQQQPLLYLFRTAGRCYYPLVNQPKILRRRHLKFVCNGQIEDSAEVDLHATYWVLLASQLDASRCKDTLIQDLAGGCFYERLNHKIGNKFEEPQDLKVAVQKECLFGRRDFGKTSLFSAMERLYPDLARLIRYHRRHHSVKWLSEKLTHAESAFFIDRLLPFVVNAGTSALPIHDALVVPASRADQVETWCRDLAKDHFGFVPKFKTKIGNAAA
jgi:hypothetical protein